MNASSGERCSVSVVVIVDDDNDDADHHHHNDNDEHVAAFLCRREPYGTPLLLRPTKRCRFRNKWPFRTHTALWPRVADFVRKVKVAIVGTPSPVRSRSASASWSAHTGAWPERVRSQSAVRCSRERHPSAAATRQ